MTTKEKSAHPDVNAERWLVPPLQKKLIVRADLSKPRKQLVGEVVSARAAKTIAVIVERRVPHTFYKRVVNKRKKFYAHDADQIAREGDIVSIVECRPLSKMKRWRLVEVIRKASLVSEENDEGTGHLRLVS